MIQTYALFLDIGIACLLVVTIAYAWVLNRKLTSLRQAKSELGKQIVEFQKATETAEVSLSGLRNAADEVGGPLQEQIDRAERSFADLKFLVDTANGIADRLEGALASSRRPAGVAAHGRERVARAEGSGQPETSASRQERDAAETIKAKSVSPQQADLIRALQGVR